MAQPYKLRRIPNSATSPASAQEPLPAVISAEKSSPKQKTSPMAIRIMAYLSARQVTPR
jgi:hypothetical protein